MGRIAGVSAEETRARLLAAAAAAFEVRGFEGTRVADIAEDAGVSKGAVYGHFRSKAELLSASLHDRGSADLAELFRDQAQPSILDLLLAFGRDLLHRPASEGRLVVEALVAARRDEEVAAVMTRHLLEHHAWLVDLLAEGQREGAVDPGLAPGAITRFCMMLVLGSLLLPTTGLPPVDQDDWSRLVAAVVDAVRPTDRAEEAP